LSSLGFSAQIAKPVYREHVLTCLKEIHGIETEEKKIQTRFGIEEPKAHAEDVPKHLNILLAEDNKMNQKVAVTMLKKLGHTITIAENGQEALDLFSKKSFHLILMDGQMPIMDGLEATQAIRKREQKNPSRSHIPIIALTANAMKGDRERFLDSGMDDYITKPIKRKALEDAIIRSSASDHLTEKDAIETKEPVIFKGDIIDLDELIKTMNGDKNLVKECFDDFYQNHGPMLNEIRIGIDQGDKPKVKDALLTFRDSVKNLSCKMIMDAAFSLDRAYGSGKTTRIEKEFERLYQACGKLKNFIVRYSVNNLFMKFLLVDDEFASRKKAQKILSQYGECDVAMNGLEALNAVVRSHNENDRYNLIFLDIEMPDLDGIQVLKKIKQWEKSKQIDKADAVKIIMMSGDDSVEMMETSLKEGSEAYIVKPLNRDKLGQAFKQVHYI
jgi:CheY-like chemotaxis protein